MIGNLIAKRLSELNMSPSELSRKTGISHATISRIINGEIKSPRSENLPALSKALHVSIDWLVTGKESKASNPITTNFNKDCDNTISIPVLIDQTSQHNHFNVLVGIDMNMNNLKKLVDFSDPNKLSTYSMNDDSMLNTLNVGDWLLIDTSVNQIDKIGIYLVDYSGEECIRRFQITPKKELLMIPDNGNYQTFIIENLQDLKVIGKVIYSWNGRRV